jgi:FtsP/CotA-like multicopper oxidase with cupredoxin domain
MFAATMTNKATPMKRLLPTSLAALTALLCGTAQAAAPGVAGTSFNLTAQASYISQPDGQAVYSWGYGCLNTTGLMFLPSLSPTVTATCTTMQIPGPTLIVTQGQSITVNLTNNLPVPAGNTSILFPGFTLSNVSGGVQGLLTREAPPCPTTGCTAANTVSYTFTATTPGTHAYYSGTQGDLQVEMGLYGAIIVLPSGVPAACGSVGTPSATATTGLPVTHPGFNSRAKAAWSEGDYRLAAAAYNHPGACYDREYLFQFSEMDPNIHTQALAQVNACAAPGAPANCHLNVPTEPYHPAYFMINGRSMPDNMDTNYAAQYPHQPYNGNPHMHPGELTLLRIIGQGRWQHPFHEHGNHVRILARDGNLITSDPAVFANLINYPTGTGTVSAAGLAGPLLFTTTTTPGQTMDGIFYWTARGLNWDAYGHHTGLSSDTNATLGCTPDANGYNTGAPTAINYFEWCQDHNKPLEKAPFGDVGAGGPATLPDPNLFTNGPWYSGSPYLGPDATARATFGACTGSGTSTQCGTTGSTPPSGTIANPPSSEAGFAFMWHSHNEREITTNNIFPGGMLMMMLVDSREFVIDETN